MKIVIQRILYSLSRAVLRKYKPEIIAITGSVGKTSAKEAIYVVLKTNYLVRRTAKNYNNEIGLPLTILGASSPGKSISGWLRLLWYKSGLLFHYAKNYPWMLILEMGADKPGDIAYLMDIAMPKVGIITAIAPAHIEHYDSIEDLAYEKGTIIRNLRVPGSWAVLNADDTRVMALSHTTKARVLTYGVATSADMRITHVHEHLSFDPDDKQLIGMVVSLSYQGRGCDVDLPGIVGISHAYAIAAAACTGVIYDMTMGEIALALRSYDTQSGRMRVLPGIKHTLLVDDTYNASPTAMVAAIETLSRFRLVSSARKIAVLGDMLELGRYTESEHTAIGRLVASKGIGMLIAVGPGGRMIADAALAAGIDKGSVLWFDTSVAAQKTVQQVIKKGDVLLVKGSQGMRMEHIVKEIMAQPEKAADLLVRQGSEWS